jgi:hypothetical protein
MFIVGFKGVEPTLSLRQMTQLDFPSALIGPRVCHSAIVGTSNWELSNLLHSMLHAKPLLCGARWIIHFQFLLHCMLHARPLLYAARSTTHICCFEHNCTAMWQAYPHRTDGKLYRLQTPQTPIARTRRYNQYCMDEFPGGTNMIVAVVAYTGYGEGCFAKQRNPPSSLSISLPLCLPLPPRLCLSLPLSVSLSPPRLCLSLSLSVSLSPPLTHT